MASYSSAPSVFKSGLNLNKPADQGQLRLCIAKPNYVLDRMELYWLAVSSSCSADLLCATAFAAVQLERVAGDSDSTQEERHAALERAIKSIVRLKQHQDLQLQWELQCLGAGDSTTLAELGIPDKSVLTWTQLPPTPVPDTPTEAPTQSAALPFACAPQHVCIPGLPYLRWLAARSTEQANRFMANVENFTVLHPVYGAVTWIGSSDVRGLDLSEVQLGGAELLLAPGLLPNTAQVVLRAVQPRGSPPAPCFVRGVAESHAVQAVKDALSLVDGADSQADWDEYHRILMHACPQFTSMLLGSVYDIVHSVHGAARGPAASAGGAKEEQAAGGAPLEGGALVDFQAQLRSACSSMSAYFVGYDQATAEWAFHVVPS